MKHALPLGIGLALCLTAARGEGENVDLVGTWVRTNGESEISISHCGEDLCAVNNWVRDPDSDEKAGDVLVMSLHEDAPGKLAGEAYDKRRDCRYSISLSMTPDSLRTEGCVLFGIVCKSAEWKRER